MYNKSSQSKINYKLFRIICKLFILLYNLSYSCLVWKSLQKVKNADSNKVKPWRCQKRKRKWTYSCCIRAFKTQVDN